VDLWLADIEFMTARDFYNDVKAHLSKRSRLAGASIATQLIATSTACQIVGK